MKNQPSTLLIISFCYNVKALVVGNIKIVGQAGMDQFLPGTYINTIPRWTVEPSDIVDNEIKSISMKRLIGTGFLDDGYDSEESTTAEQFVNPSSNEELWWPADLEKLQIRPTIDIFMKSAIPTYILAGVETRVPAEYSEDSKEWKNFGMNSQPVAGQWTTFNLAAENNFRIETFIAKVISEDDDAKKDEDDNEEKNEVMSLQPILSDGGDDASCIDQKAQALQGTSNAIQTFGALMASLKETSPLLNGMHIISIPISSNWVDLPNPSDLKEKEKYKVISVATVESSASELLELDEDLIAMSASSVLEVDVQLIEPGSKSEFIPAVYKPLYIKQ
mmetsp:Transcript_3546/g.4694  ORF Transcript_3546/g.4694 Transcript_3546/m.4694 type:complete len:334 (-) Transcript_3546:49-1050(-)